MGPLINKGLHAELQTHLEACIEKLSENTKIVFNNINCLPDNRKWKWTYSDPDHRWVEFYEDVWRNQHWGKQSFGEVSYKESQNIHRIIELKWWVEKKKPINTQAVSNS